jgi:hypothetical protein
MSQPLSRTSALWQSLTSLTSGVARAGRRSTVLGAVLLAASTATVLATGNTQPTITSAAVNRHVFKEGETVTLAVSFTDPDLLDYHTARIRWDDGSPTQSFQIPVGQTSFQVEHRLVGDNEGPEWRQGRITLYDRQTAPGTPQNDNSGDHALKPDRYFSIQISNAEPSFVSRSVTVTPKGRTHVTVEGEVTDPGAADHLQVTASWGDSSPPVTSVCSVSASRHFVCEHDYRPNLQAKAYPVLLVVNDEKGALTEYRTTARLP